MLTSPTSPGRGERERGEIFDYGDRLVNKVCTQ